MSEFSGVLKEKEIEALLQPYLLPGITVPADLYHQLANYLQLLLKWNARTNLTAIRNPEEIVRRHFGESLFAAQHVGPCKTLLDFGSGAGFPGLPIQLMRSEIQVTLAESQNKKATFLREAIRTLDLRTVVWGARVEAMPPAMRFDVVTLRAVDRMDAAIAAGSSRCGRQMMLLTTANYAPAEPAGFAIETRIPLPNAMEQQLLSFIRQG